MAARSKYNLRVLFVDDEASLTELMQSELPRMGHTTTVCSTPGEANKAVDENTFDAAIIDLKMPGGSGWDVVDHLRTVSPETEYVISTGHGDMDATIQAIRSGAYDFLPKPVSLFEIAAVLQRIGEKNRWKTEMQHLRISYSVLKDVPISSVSQHRCSEFEN
ncbi:MAG: response regulator [Fuerstiella sp.]|nr:response regulator [Fuerstiella sp.]